MYRPPSLAECLDQLPPDLPSVWRRVLAQQLQAQWQAGFSVGQRYAEAHAYQRSPAPLGGG